MPKGDETFFLSKNNSDTIVIIFSCEQFFSKVIIHLAMLTCVKPMKTENIFLVTDNAGLIDEESLPVA